MSFSLVYLEARVYDVFGMRNFEDHTCHHICPTTGQNCSVNLTESSINNVRAIVKRLALQSPSCSRSDFIDIHRFNFVETLRQLATHTLCPTHATPIRITNTMLDWLEIAAAFSDVFEFGHQLSALQPDLHRILPLLALRYEPESWSRILPLWLHALDIIARRGIIFERSDAILDISHQFIRQLVRDVTSTLAEHHGEDDEGNLQDMSEYQLPQWQFQPHLITHEDDEDNASASDLPALRLTVPPIPARSPLRTSPGDQDGNREPNQPPSPFGGSPATPLDEECPICHEPISRFHRTTACGTCRKVFHLQCMRQWEISQRTISGRSVTCPLCRAVWDDPMFDPSSLASRVFVRGGDVSDNEDGNDGGIDVEMTDDNYQFAATWRN